MQMCSLAAGRQFVYFYHNHGERQKNTAVRAKASARRVRAILLRVGGSRRIIAIFLGHSLQNVAMAAMPRDRSAHSEKHPRQPSTGDCPDFGGLRRAQLD
jgi:hypothetical protein